MSSPDTSNHPPSERAPLDPLYADDSPHKLKSRSTSLHLIHTSPSFSNLDFYPGQIPPGMESSAPYGYQGSHLLPVHKPEKRKTLTFTRSRAASVGEKDRQRRHSQGKATLSGSYASQNPRKQRRRSRTLSGVRLPDASALAISHPTLQNPTQSIRQIRNNALATLTGATTSVSDSEAPPLASSGRSIRSVRSFRNEFAAPATGSSDAPRLPLTSISSFRVGELAFRDGDGATTPLLIVTEDKDMSAKTIVVTSQEPEHHRQPQAEASRDRMSRLRVASDQGTISRPAIVVVGPKSALRHSRSLGVLALQHIQQTENDISTQNATTSRIIEQQKWKGELPLSPSIGITESIKTEKRPDQTSNTMTLSRSFSRLGLAKKPASPTPISRKSPTSNNKTNDENLPSPTTSTHPHYRKITRSDTSPHLQLMLASAGLPNLSSETGIDKAPSQTIEKRGLGIVFPGTAPVLMDTSTSSSSKTDVGAPSTDEMLASAQRGEFEGLGRYPTIYPPSTSHLPSAYPTHNRLETYSTPSRPSANSDLGSNVSVSGQGSRYRMSVVPPESRFGHGEETSALPTYTRVKTTPTIPRPSSPESKLSTKTPAISQGPRYRMSIVPPGPSVNMQRADDSSGRKFSDGPDSAGLSAKEDASAAFDRLIGLPRKRSGKDHEVGVCKEGKLTGGDDSVGSRYSLDEGTLNHSQTSSALPSQLDESRATLSTNNSQLASPSAGKTSFEESNPLEGKSVSLSPQMRTFSRVDWEQPTLVVEKTGETDAGATSKKKEKGGTGNIPGRKAEGSMKSVVTLRKKVSHRLLSMFSPGQVIPLPSPGISHTSYFSTPPASPVLDILKQQAQAAAAATTTTNNSSAGTNIETEFTMTKTERILAWREQVMAHAEGSKLEDMIARHLTEERARLQEYGIEGVESGGSEDEGGENGMDDGRSQDELDLEV